MDSVPKEPHGAAAGASPQGKLLTCSEPGVLLPKRLTPQQPCREALEVLVTLESPSYLDQPSPTTGTIKEGFLPVRGSFGELALEL